jgi:L-fuculose-phosphate aldolase
VATVRDQRSQIVRYAHLVYEKGWVANHDGNLTARLPRGRYLSTPTATSKGDVDESKLIVVDRDRNVLQGRERSFSEFALHVAIYDERSDVDAVIHAHPPFATALAVSGGQMLRPIIPESVVSIGPAVPLVPFAAPGSEAATRQLAEAIARYDVVLLENHGVVAAGDDLEQAFLRVELVEHLARILHNSQAFGGPQFLSDAVVEPLLDKRRDVGLGPEARGVGRRDAYREYYQASSGSGARRAGRAASTRGDEPSTDRIVELVTEELLRTLGSS